MIVHSNKINYLPSVIRLSHIGLSVSNTLWKTKISSSYYYTSDDEFCNDKDCEDSFITMNMDK